MNLKLVTQHFSEQLEGLYDEAEITSIFFLVAEHLSGLKRMELLGRKDEPLTIAIYNNYQNVLSELAKGVPVQYVLGETVFYGLSFKVNPAVLIPRPETEELVDWIIGDLKSRSGLKIMDIGTGSGCIAITLEKKLPGNVVIGLDISSVALQVAKANATLNESDVIFTEADIRTYGGAEKYDVIVSNPPYITMDEKAEMHENVLTNEPHLALFVSNERPLIFYEAIADFANASLKEDGLLYFEINEHLGPETVAMLVGKSFSAIELRKDMQGKNRMIRCRRTV